MANLAIGQGAKLQRKRQQVVNNNQCVGQYVCMLAASLALALRSPRVSLTLA
eukprot:SAG31_NODE_856_length_11439_cov_3.721233_10_plen_52_part_00